jgi:hypothetical protein
VCMNRTKEDGREVGRVGYRHTMRNKKSRLRGIVFQKIELSRMKLLWYLVSVDILAQIKFTCEQKKRKYLGDCIVMMYVHQIQFC